MPEFLEKKLKKEYGAKSKVPFKIMNSIGAMRGNKVTEKGIDMEKKHLRGLGGPEIPRKKKSRRKKKSFAGALIHDDDTD